MQNLNENLIRRFSQQRKEPGWMLEMRLKGWELFEKTKLPDWGPDLRGIKFEKIDYFKAGLGLPKRSWKEVDKETKQVFDKLGLPETERKVLSGVGAQWNSGVVYKGLKEKLIKQGVIFESMDEAVKKYPELVKKYFMKIMPLDNKFGSLHAAVWSGGVFIYVPKGVKISQPIEGFFWLNNYQGGQFEHTIIIAEEDSELTYIEGCSAPRFQKEALHVGCVEIAVGKKAKVKTITLQNWSKNVLNLGMKRAVAEAGGVMEWVGVNLGSKITMSYPTSILKGKGAKAEHLSLSLADKGQEIDSGGGAVLLAADTSANIISKSISLNGGVSSYRGKGKIIKGAKGAKLNIKCDGLILDNKSQSKTFPQMEIGESESTALHEAKTGRISEEEMIYLMSRGLNEEEAMSLIINGFIEPVVKEMPLEYAVEINKIMELYVKHCQN